MFVTVAGFTSLQMDAKITDSEDFVEVVASKKQHFCPHCSQNVGFSTFYHHQDRFFDVATNEWWKGPTHVTDSDDFQTIVEDSVSVCEFEESHVHSYNETYLQESAREQENYEGVLISTFN